MKTVEIFNYESMQKFYLSSEVIEDQRPHIGLPGSSTDLRPPFEKITPGFIPVFNGEDWNIVPDTFWRPNQVEVNYDAGRKQESYSPLSLSLCSHHFIGYPTMQMLCNPFLVTQAIDQRVLVINKKLNLILELHKAAFSAEHNRTSPDLLSVASPNTTPSKIYEYKLESESMIYLMRRILDSLVQLTFLLTNHAKFEETKIITHGEIGRFVDIELATSDMERIIIGDDADYQKDPTNFLRIFNDLFNSFKHSLMHDESYLLMCPDIPSITSYQAKRNNHNNEIIYHNHNLYHLMMGFEDNVLRILSNQKIYKSKKREFE